MEVHKELGCGFLEAVYQEAMEKEMLFRKLPFKPKPNIEIMYKGERLNKSYQPDFICYDEIILEIKALTSLSRLEEAQIINYLKACRLKVGLLINFGSKSLEHRRFIF